MRRGHRVDQWWAAAGWPRLAEAVSRGSDAASTSSGRLPRLHGMAPLHSPAGPAVLSTSLPIPPNHPRAHTTDPTEYFERFPATAILASSDNLLPTNPIGDSGLEQPPAIHSAMNIGGRPRAARAAAACSAAGSAPPRPLARAVHASCAAPTPAGLLFFRHGAPTTAFIDAWQQRLDADDKVEGRWRGDVAPLVQHAGTGHRAQGGASLCCLASTSPRPAPPCPARPARRPGTRTCSIGWGTRG